MREISVYVNARQICSIFVAGGEAVGSPVERAFGGRGENAST